MSLRLTAIEWLSIVVVGGSGAYLAFGPTPTPPPPPATGWSVASASNAAAAVPRKNAHAFRRPPRSPSSGISA